MDVPFRICVLFGIVTKMRQKTITKFSQLQIHKRQNSDKILKISHGNTKCVTAPHVDCQVSSLRLSYVDVFSDTNTVLNF